MRIWDILYHDVHYTFNSFYVPDSPWIGFYRVLLLIERLGEFVEVLLLIRVPPVYYRLIYN